MTEPTTINKIMTVPLTGDLVGAWGTAALNPNFNILDGILGGVVNISATTTLTTLTTPTGTASPGGGPFQSTNALIRFSGTLTGNMQVVFQLPGFYIVENLAAGNATCYIQLKPSNGTGNNIGAPPGKKQHIFFDGTNMDYMNMPDVGSYMDLAVSTSPLWMTACTVQPWLPCIGTAVSTMTYSNLFTLIGTTFGASGGSFLTPDLQSRYRVPIDSTGVNRITSAGSGVNGASLGAAGGNQLIQSHTHTVIDPGHRHTYAATLAVAGQPGSSSDFIIGSANQNTGSSTTGITLGTTGSGSSGNIPPVLVTGMSFIKT